MGRAEAKALIDIEAQQADALRRFSEMLKAPTADGKQKRVNGEKPPWYIDPAHEAAIFSHLLRWKRGELSDPHTGSHPLVHLAWRALAIAAIETGNVPECARRVPYPLPDL